MTGISHDQFNWMVISRRQSSIWPLDKIFYSRTRGYLHLAPLGLWVSANLPPGDFNLCKSAHRVDCRNRSETYEPLWDHINYDHWSKFTNDLGSENFCKKLGYVCDLSKSSWTPELLNLRELWGILLPLTKCYSSSPKVARTFQVVPLLICTY